MSPALLVGLSLSVAVAAPPRSSDGSGPWLAALYLAGDSDLWQTAQYAADTALALTAAGMTTVVLLDGPPGPDSRARVFVRGAGGTSVHDRGRLNSGSAGVLARFTRYARDLRPGGPRALIILGHGKPPASGPDPWRLMTVAGGLGEDWGAGGDSLDPAEVEEALRGQTWDLVVLACCHGASVEHLWAVRQAARYVAAAPGELSMTGGEVGRMVGSLASRPSAQRASEMSARILAGAAGDAGAMWMAAARLVEVGERLRAVGVELRRQARTCARALQAVRPLLPSWGPAGEMADLGALARALDQSVADPRVKAGAQALAASVAGAVHRTGGRAPSAGPFAATNLGVFLPPLQTEPWKDYDKHAPFGRVTQWTITLAALHQAAVEDGSAVGAGIVEGARLARTEAKD